ncbi:hypothetical protein JXM83_07170 [Candidatus Woesearchaeota archaeon]|nr:hypothetical protein [Candidatus Woesearchaeota archaeon]
MKNNITHQKADEFIKELDFFYESKKSEIQLINWLLAILTGLLLITISNFDKFIVNQEIFLKPFFIVIFLSLGFSILNLGVLRFIHFLSEFGLSTMCSCIKKLQWRIENNIGDNEEDMKKIEERIGGWVLSSNILNKRGINLKIGFVSFFVVIIMYIVYFILFIIFIN